MRLAIAATISMSVCLLAAQLMYGCSADSCKPPDLSAPPDMMRCDGQCDCLPCAYDVQCPPSLCAQSSGNYGDCTLETGFCRWFGVN